jgi:hypothetical protein
VSHRPTPAKSAYSDRDTARFVQILDTWLAARRRVTLVAAPPPPPEAAALDREFYWLEPDWKAATDAIRERYGTLLELALQTGWPWSKIEALTRSHRVAALRIGSDGEWRFDRDEVRSLIWAAEAAERWMRDPGFVRYHPKNKEAAVDRALNDPRIIRQRPTTGLNRRSSAKLGVTLRPTK